MNDTTIALALLLVVLVVAAIASRQVAIVTSLVAFAAYNFFFLPPTGALTIANPADAVALFALLGVSLIGSHLAYRARSKAAEAVAMAQARNEADIARRSAEAKSALVASLSHDLKTPLTALTVAAGNLRDSELTDDERREQLHIIDAELGRLQRLFDNVVEMASLETQAVSAAPEWVHPEEIVDASRQQTAPRLGSRVVMVRVDPEQRLVLIDPRLTSAALSHVLENAALYSPSAAPISIEVHASDQQLRIAVRDGGPGLSSDEIGRVFKADDRGIGTKDRFGSGMGLAIARGLIGAQGGDITAANHPQGGALFTLTVPVTTRAAADVEVA